jgi:pimeloyl-ACP methyl ester carboxylesterase
MTATATPTRHSPPSDFLALTEAPRALMELASFVALRPAMSFLPRGDGHPVLVLPGFSASDASTAPLRGYLRRQGYSAHGWGQGRNRGPRPGVELGMLRRLEHLYWTSGRKVSVVGWSLGGIYARELARQRPEMVRLVVTLGSPFASARSTNVDRLFEAVSGLSIDELDKEFLRRMREAPPVPSTAVYSTSDGIAHWEACVDSPEGAETENVRVPGSHCGLGHNPLAVYVIADRLAQSENGWRRFERSSWRSLVFPPSVTPYNGNARAPFRPATAQPRPA